MQVRCPSSFKHLALLAMLALVLLPPVGRLAQSSAMEAMPLAQAAGTQGLAPMASHGEHCASMAEPAVDGRDPPRTLPGEDCAYCPILAALSLPGAQPIVVSALLWILPRDQRGTAGRPGRIAITGLGARGPPLAI